MLDFAENAMKNLFHLIYGQMRALSKDILTVKAINVESFSDMSLTRESRFR